MKLWKKILLGLLLVLTFIQFIQPVRNKGSQSSSKDLIKVLNVPGNVQNILKRACYDCHSNHTSYPWYANIQPFGWLLANHIKEGKAELNFNAFSSYSKRRQISKLNGIANSVKKGSMPLGSYRMMHKNSRLSKEEKVMVFEWAIKMKDSLQLNR